MHGYQSLAPRRERDRLSVEIETKPSVNYMTELIGTRNGFDRTNEQVFGARRAMLRVARCYSKDIGAVLATVPGGSASYTLKGDEIDIRSHRTSSKLKADPYRAGEFEQAWTQPVVTGVL